MISFHFPVFFREKSQEAPIFPGENAAPGPVPPADLCGAGAAAHGSALVWQYPLVMSKKLWKIAMKMWSFP